MPLDPDQYGLYKALDAAMQAYWMYWANAHPPKVDPSAWDQRRPRVFADAGNPDNLGIAWEFPGEHLLFSFPWSDGPVTVAPSLYDSGGAVLPFSDPLRLSQVGYEDDGTPYKVDWVAGRWVRTDSTGKLREVIDNNGVFMRMPETHLATPEDFKNIPDLGKDEEVFDKGRVQEIEHWLINNVLPPGDTQLPKTWRIAEDTSSDQFDLVVFDTLAEPNIKPYRFVDAFFVERDGKKMLRIGLEWGGHDQLIHINSEYTKLWNDPEIMKSFIAALNCDGQVLMLIDSHGKIVHSPETYEEKVTRERHDSGDQLMKDWVANRKFPNSADRTVFDATEWPIVK